MTATLSIRIPQKRKAALDRAAKQTQRSRSFLVNEALEKHLAEIAKAGSADTLGDELNSETKRAANDAKWLAFAAALAEARKHFPTRTAEDIDASIRDMREDRKW